MGGGGGGGEGFKQVTNLTETKEAKCIFLYIISLFIERQSTTCMKLLFQRSKQMRIGNSTS